jgi:hypothetical protein
MIAVVCFTDGRTNLLRRTVASFDAMVTGPIIERWIYDDSGNRKQREMLAARYPHWTLINHPSGERQGFGGAIETAWRHLARESVADWVFHLEDDFTFNRPLDTVAMCEVLAKRPKLAQMALRRQPWNHLERRHGGIVEQHPGDFVTHCDALDNVWLEHTRFFTTNPCIYPMALVLNHAWPEGAGSEGRFGVKLCQLGYNFAYWGPREDPPWVHHIGAERVGKDY